MAKKIKSPTKKEKRKEKYCFTYKKNASTHEQDSIDAINKSAEVRYIINAGVNNDGTEFTTIRFDGVDAAKLKKLFDKLEKVDPRKPFNPFQ